MKLWKKFLGVILVVLVSVLFIPNNVKAEEVGENPLNLILNEDGKLEIKGSVPSDMVDFIIKLMFKLLDEENVEASKVETPDFSDDFKKAKITIDKDTTEPVWVDVEYIYDELVEQKVKEILDFLINDEASSTGEIDDAITLSDLEMIHYYYYNDKFKSITQVENGVEQKVYFINSFSTKIKEDINYKNLNFRLIAFDIAEGNQLKGKSLGAVGVYEYNNSAYYLDSNGAIFDLKHIFYVPSDTEDDTEIIKSVAQKRISDYLQNDKVKLTYLTTAEFYTPISEKIDTCEDVYEHDFGLKDIKCTDYIYKVEMEIAEGQTITFDMVIKRDTEKMINLFQSVDLMSGVEVSANRPINLDVLLSVAQLTSGEEYDRIIKLLGLTSGVTYDINLYSRVLDKYITELDDGTFEVKIPIPEELEGKDLTVYHVNEDGKIEEYEVTIKDGYAIFRTNHFSIYTLGITKTNEIIENPQTIDNISKTIIFSGISLITLISATIYMKKKLN